MGNLTGKSSDANSVMDSSPLLRCRLDLPATLPHDPSAGRDVNVSFFKAKLSPQKRLTGTSEIAAGRVHGNFERGAERRAPPVGMRSKRSVAVG